MIDAAYWHLVRRYSEARHTDPSAEAEIDELNEAYSVLRSSARREEYYRLRDAILGAGALPAPPAPEPQPVPLEVMARQRPRPRELEQPGKAEPGRRGIASLAVPGWQNVVAALVILGLATAALVDAANPLVVAALLGSGVGVTTLPLWRFLV
ncbi:MAG: hypothetical protein U1B78_00335, partial [Dehalococcoidia bacterium]|nr:hypothetical protein [Dehalococcoidia bacterium]